LSLKTTGLRLQSLTRPKIPSPRHDIALRFIARSAVLVARDDPLNRRGRVAGTIQHLNLRGPGAHLPPLLGLFVVGELRRKIPASLALAHTISTTFIRLLTAFASVQCRDDQPPDQSGTSVCPYCRPCGRAGFFRFPVSAIRVLPLLLASALH
jgi:hypothetical protein